MDNTRSTLFPPSPRYNIICTPSSFPLNLCLRSPSSFRSSSIHMAWSLFQMQRVSSSCAIDDKEHNFKAPSDHELLFHHKHCAHPHLRSPPVHCIYLVPKDTTALNQCNQCNFSSITGERLLRITVFHCSHPSSKSRVPGARDHQWQRLRLSHTAPRPIETCGRRTAPQNSYWEAIPSNMDECRKGGGFKGIYVRMGKE